MKPPTLAFALLLSVVLPSLCGAWSAVAPSHASLSFSGTCRAAAAAAAAQKPSLFPSAARSSSELHALPSAVSAAVSLIRGGAKAASNLDLDLDRVAFRLEGLEIYSLVMALFMGSALGLMESTPLKSRRGRTARRTRTRPWILWRRGAFMLAARMPWYPAVSTCS